MMSHAKYLLALVLALVLASSSSTAFCGSGAVLVAGKTEIVIDKASSPVAAFAAKEMKYFLDAALSCDVPVVTKPSGRRTPIHLGSGRWTKNAGIVVDGMKRDEFRVVVRDGAVYIAGRDDPKTRPERALTRNVWNQHYERATLFGAYDFLERFAGVRMYFPGELGEIIPKTVRIDVPDVDYSSAPYTPGRYFSYASEGEWFEGEKRDAKSTMQIRWLNAYRLRMQTRYIPFCHGLSHRGYLRRFGKSNPEYFRLNEDGTRDMNLALGNRSGKLCYTSGIWEEIYRDAKSYLKGESADVRGVVNPNGAVNWWFSCQDRRYVDLMPHDGMRPCQCEKCKAAYDTDDSGDYMDTIMWSNMAKLGNRLISEGVDGYLTQMAYQPYRRVPDVDLPSNILVMVAVRGPWSVPYDVQVRKEHADIEAWVKKLGHKVAIWTYPCKYGKRKIANIPDLAPWCWGKYYKGVSKWVDDVYAESDTDRFIYRHLDDYVFSRVTWDPNVDVDAVIDEYFRLMYGPAAPEMKSFFKSLEEKWTTGLLSRVEDTVWGPSITVASEDERWNKVYTSETLAGYEKLLSAAEAKTKPGTLERRRVDLMRRELFDPLASERRLFCERGARLASVNFRFGDGVPLALKKFSDRDEAVPDDLRTEVFAEKRDGGLFVSVIAWEKRMSDASSLERCFDDTEIWLDNEIELMIDPTGARREAMHFMVNSSGSWADMLHTRDASGRWKENIKWSSGAKVEVKRFADRWTCDVAIPHSAFRDGMPGKFPAEVFRKRVMNDGNAKSKDGWYIWGAYSKGPCDFENFGTWEIAPKKGTQKGRY